jgi:FkbM family methyltransferase
MKKIIDAISIFKENIDTSGIILWGAGPNLPIVIDLLEKLNLKKSIKGVFDSTKVLHEDQIHNIKVLSNKEIRSFSYDNNIIIACAGLNELYGLIVPEHLFYFRIIHRKALEVYVNLSKISLDIIQNNIDLLTDDLSKIVYEKRIELILSSVMFDSHFKTNGGPYFGNDLIRTLDGSWLYAGAYNGKHLDRALSFDRNQKLIAIEPSVSMFKILSEKFKSDPRISLYNNLLWSESDKKINYNDDSLHQGLAASVFQNNQFGSNSIVDTITIDDLVGNRRLSQLALDVEGSEQEAIKGAINTIPDLKNGCAVCIYHNFDDYIKLPGMLSELSNKKYLSVRQHSCIPFIETVLYAHN